MNNPICSSAFDSRDLIAYKDQLISELLDYWKELYEGQYGCEVDDIDFDDEAFNDLHSDEIEHYKEIEAFISELEDYGDFLYGETIIHQDCFTDYTEELCRSIYSLGNIPEYIVIDWEETAENIKIDYTYATYEGEEYYIRA